MYSITIQRLGLVVKDAIHYGIACIHKINEGWFSEIHKAKWKNTVVAVKQINFQSATEQHLKDFKEEILLFRTLNRGFLIDILQILDLILKMICFYSS
jgi:predicted metal-dependent TIM-barrel fold hydrolase